MDSLILKAPARPVFQVSPQHSHPRLSLTKVLWTRFLRWIDKATPQAILKVLKRSVTLLLVSALVFIPQHLLGILTASARWSGIRIPLFLALLYLTLNAKRLWTRWTTAAPRTSANQHLFHGLPVSEFASFLLEKQSFKRDEAIRTLGLSQGQYRTIAEELKLHGVLVHGENNAHVLRPISRAELVQQLRDNFPLMWDEVHQDWTEKHDAYGRWLRAEGFRTRKLTEQTERAERKLERTKKQIEKAQDTVFSQVFAHSAITPQ